jgi:uncharacterized membrane protein
MAGPNTLKRFYTAAMGHAKWLLVLLLAALGVSAALSLTATGLGHR